MKALWGSLALVFLAGSAYAAGLNLAWNNCYPSPGAASNMSFVCDDSSPGAGDANHQTFRLYGSVITGFDLDGVLAWEARVDWQVANPVLDPWWQLATGERPDGALAFSFNGFTDGTSCDQQLMMPASPAIVGAFDWGERANGNRKAQLAMIAGRTTPVSMAASTEYQLFCVQIDSRNTRIDGGDGTTAVCAGCLDPACMVLTYLELDVPPAGGNYGKNVFTQPDQRQHVTWQGGSIGGLGCPAQVPVHRTTWGEVRTLYR